ncbi:hypothetical protein BX616_002642, partial [Lobosporangium transversale]
MENEERDLSNLTPTRYGLFQLALGSLICLQEDYYDRGNVSTEKDAFIALPCTLYLASPKLQSYFEEDIDSRGLCEE